MLENHIRELLRKLRNEMKMNFNRHVPIQDLLSDRWETAEFYGFGEGSSCYNSVVILGEVKVGKNSWIGPNVVLDGRGGLEIGDHVSISAGVQIYSHNTVQQSISLGRSPIEFESTKIGDGVYIGPNSVVQMGTNICDKAVIGAMSFVNRDVPQGGKWYGTSLLSDKPS